MNAYVNRSIFQLPFFILFLLTSCTTLPPQSKDNNQLAYVADHDESIIRQHLPVFVIASQNAKHNLIGTPSVRIVGEAKEEVYVNPERPSIYAERREFTTSKDSYTNLIYRIHFEKVPFSLWPFQLGWGKNVGVIVVVTLNREGKPILYTTVQTCGCYLAFIPTSYMPLNAFPDNWNKDRQVVYGERLPGLLDFKELSLDQPITLISLRNHSHRVADLLVANVELLKDYKTEKAILQPLDALQKLPLAGAGATSFYENAGHLKGYVKGNSKPWEKLLMGWWALDWKVGRDKKLGRDKDDGPMFYTSLKPWARGESDMRDFASFLRYWGWGL